MVNGIYKILEPLWLEQCDIIAYTPPYPSFFHLPQVYGHLKLKGKQWILDHAETMCADTGRPKQIRCNTPTNVMMIQIIFVLSVWDNLYLRLYKSWFSFLLLFGCCAFPHLISFPILVYMQPPPPPLYTIWWSWMHTIETMSVVCRTEFSKQVWCSKLFWWNHITLKYWGYWVWKWNI